MSESGLARHYADLNARFTVTDDHEMAGLVVPNGNGSAPVHRWFHLKEAFSLDLVPAVLDRWRNGAGGEVFLDPYAGVGTSTLVASAPTADGVPRFQRSFGIESNPFLHFVAATKVAARAGGAPGLRDLAKDAARQACSDAVDPAPTPGLSSFVNSAFFQPSDLKRLLQLRSAVEASDAPETTRAVARLCLAASVEPVSALRRDGRALRYEPKKTRVDPVAEFLTRVDLAADDVGAEHILGSATVIRGDGRRSDTVLPKMRSFSVAVFSPPYLNNIDYTEVYKLEAWFLGLYASQAAFKEQRLRTVRSHPSVRFPETFGASANGHKPQFDALILPLLDVLPADRYRVWRGPLFRGYFDDMLETLVSLRRIANPDSLVVYVVGNSLHGAHKNHFLVAADLMIARLAELAGFDVIEIVVARRPKRRQLGGDLLRESIVALVPSTRDIEAR